MTDVSVLSSPQLVSSVLPLAQVPGMMIVSASPHFIFGSQDGGRTELLNSEGVVAKQNNLVSPILEIIKSTCCCKSFAISMRNFSENLKRQTLPYALRSGLQNLL